MKKVTDEKQYIHRCYRYNIGMSMATISFRVDEGNIYEETNFVLHITHC